MRNGLPGVFLLALVLVPCAVAGVQALAAGSAGTSGDSLASLPNVSFPGQAPTAQDWYDQGFALTNEGRYEEALQAYGEALAANRSLLNAWYYSGDAFSRLGRYGDALLAFENATIMDPDFVDAYFYESAVYGKMGRYQDQKDALGKGLEAADRREASAGAAVRTPPATGGGAAAVPVSPTTVLLAISLTMIFRVWRKGRV